MITVEGCFQGTRTCLAFKKKHNILFYKYIDVFENVGKKIIL